MLLWLSRWRARSEWRHLRPAIRRRMRWSWLVLPVLVLAWLRSEAWGFLAFGVYLFLAGAMNFAVGLSKSLFERWYVEEAPRKLREKLWVTGSLTMVVSLVLLFKVYLEILSGTGLN